MPGAIFHKIHGEQVINEFSAKGYRLPEDFDAFYWGLQGPDIFFCHRNLPFHKGKSLEDIGSKIHLKTAKSFFDVILELVKSSPQNTAFYSYFIGLICHYAADSVVHPYVSFKTKELNNIDDKNAEIATHVEIESSIDTIALRFYEDKLPTQISLSKLLPKKKQQMEEIAKLLSESIKNFSGYNISLEEILQVEKDAHLAFSLMTDRTGIKKSFFDRLERDEIKKYSCHFRPMLENAEVDYSNILKGSWTDYNDIQRHESVFELMDMAKEKALNIISELKGDGFTTQYLLEPWNKE